MAEAVTVNKQGETEPAAAGTCRGRGRLDWWAAGGMVLIAIWLFWQCRHYNAMAYGVYGDMSTHVGAAFSLAYDGDLVFDARDAARFNKLEPFASGNGPEGLFLKRNAKNQWFFAKPILYPLFSALWVRVFGMRGQIYFNALLLLVLIGVAYLWLRKCVGGVFAFSLAAAFFLISHFYAYVFVHQPDLFVAALLVCGVFSFRESIIHRSNPWAAAAGIFLGMACYERMTLLLLVVFLGIYCLIARRRTGWVAVGALIFVMCVPMFVHFRQDGTFSPFKGDRYYMLAESTGFPFMTKHPLTIGPANAGYYNRLGSQEIGSQLIKNLPDLPPQLGNLIYGRELAVTLYTPLIVAVAIWIIWAGPGLLEYAVLAFLVTFVVVHALCFPENPFGGGNSLGDRYVLEVIGLSLLAVRPKARARIAGFWAKGGRAATVLVPAAAGIYLLWPILAAPQGAVARHAHLLAEYPETIFPLEREYLEMLRPDFYRLFSQQVKLDPSADVANARVVRLYRMDAMNVPPCWFAAGVQERMVIESPTPLAQVAVYFASEGKGKMTILPTGGDEVVLPETILPNVPLMVPTGRLVESLSRGHDQQMRYYYEWRVRTSNSDGSDGGFALSLRPLGKTIKLSETTLFGNEGDAASGEIIGWAIPEGWGCWTSGRLAQIVMGMPKVSGDVDMLVEASAFTPAVHPKQRVEVLVNGRVVAKWEYVHGEGAKTQRVRLSQELLAGPAFWLTFRLPDAATPVEMGLSTDPRLLGLAIGRINLVPAGEQMAGWNAERSGGPLPIVR